MLKFLVDESSGQQLQKALVNSGYDAIYAGDVLKGSVDERVVNKAKSENRIIITNDKDFGELLFRKMVPSSGVMLLRLKEDEPLARIITVLEAIEEYGKRLAESFAVLSEQGIRIRKLKK